MQLTNCDEIEWESRAETSAPGAPQTRYKVLQRASSPRYGELEMTVKRYPNPSFMARHRHKFDQVRYVLAGEEPYAPERATPPGRIVFTCSGTFYGPYDRPAGVELLSVKFPGADYEGHVARAGTDGTRQHVPQARFGSPVEIDPASYAWISNAPGLAHRTFGRFTERGTRLAATAVDPGTSHQAHVTQTTLGFVTSGAGRVNGEPVRLHAGVLVEADEAVTLEASERLEIFWIGVPEVVPAISLER